MSIGADRSGALLDRAIAWDNHACLPMRAEDDFLPQLQRHRQGGFTVVVVNIGFGDVAPAQHLRLIAHFRRWLKMRPEHYVLVETVADIERAKRTGRLAVAFDIEGSDALEGELSFVQLYYDLGVRWILFAYNKPSAAAGGCHGTDEGLTDWGRALQDEMERVGMLVCCSHTGRRSALELCERATRPVIYSHSNPSVVWPHDRNIDDEMIRACAATGGVVGINGIGIFLGRNDASAEAMARAIDHVAQLVGPAHVGLGLDFNFDMEETRAFLASNRELFPPEKGYTGDLAMFAPEDLPRLVDRLIALDYRDDDVLAILGGNFMRLARQVWRD